MVSEFNLSGFEILTKEASEPESIYHPIGARVAQGSPEAGAVYSLNVTTGIYPGKRYCFRLVERTTDGTPGETWDVCSFGMLAPQRRIEIDTDTGKVRFDVANVDRADMPGQYVLRIVTTGDLPPGGTYRAKVYGKTEVASTVSILHYRTSEDPWYMIATFSPDHV